MKVIHLETVASTNDYIGRFLPARENVIVCADRQTHGRGTKGRAFLSQTGGVYLSALIFYEEFPASRAFEVMAHAAVAVCRAAERFGVDAEIKWPNDVFAGGKKLSGILIENAVSDGKLDHSVVGIGLNVENDVSALGGIATSLSLEAKKPVAAAAAREELIAQFCAPSNFGEYLSRIRFLSRIVRVTENGREYDALARRVLPDGRLEIEENGSVRALSSAEIRIKL